MNNNTQHPADRPVTVSGIRLTPPRHICCFFDSRDQQYQTLVPYIMEGIANGEKTLTIMDSEWLDDHDQRLAAGGVAVDAATQAGHLCSLCTTETYLNGGSFAKLRMYQALEEQLKALPASSFTSLRTFGDMSWMLRNVSGIEELLEYESEVNNLLKVHDATFMCGYDANRIIGRTLLNILATHSHVLIGTKVHENPYYQSPEMFHQTLLARRASTRSGLGDKSQLHWSELP